jgi:hypothetical protein
VKFSAAHRKDGRESRPPALLGYSHRRNGKKCHFITSRKPCAYTWHLHMGSQCILVRCTPASFASFSLILLPLLRTISTGSVLLFLYTLYGAHSRGFHLGVSRVAILCLNQIKPPITYSFSAAQLPCCSTAYRAPCYTSSCTDALCFTIIHSVILFSSPASL